MRAISYLLTVFLALMTSLCVAQVLPVDRRIDWSRTGVPGGIPERNAIHATIDAGAYGDGSADASAAINAAIQSCPVDQVVFVPAGTYRLDSPIHFNLKQGVTLRGAGPGQTVFRPASSTGAAITTGQTGLSGERGVVSGSTKGSTSITLDDASGIEAGMILDIYQSDDPDFYWTRGLTDHTGQFVIVTAVNGSTAEFEDPLVWDFTLDPRCKHEVPGRGMSWCGVEDLTISADSTYGGSMIQFWNAYASWVKNVETAWGNGNEHIFLWGCLRCDIRECYIHDTYSTTDGYGIVTMAGYGGPRGGCTGLRIENNIFSGLWYATVLETEVGSVIAYNYSRNMRFPGWPDYQMADFNGNHGPHGMMYLMEGNVGSGGIQQDGYHGSVSHITYFRNYFSGVHAEANRTGNIKLIDLCRFSYYHNVVGNVLGTPEWPRSTTGRYEMSGTPGYTEQAVIYRLGYPNMGNNGYSTVNPPSDADDGGHDPKVKATLMRWGNYDFQNDSARWEQSEVPAGVAVPADHDLPASLYLTSRPAWWCENLPWPPIGPDVAGLANDIPAKLRYEGAPCEAIGVKRRPPRVRTLGPATVTVYNLRGQLLRRLDGDYRDGRVGLRRGDQGLPAGLSVWVVRQGHVVHAATRVGGY
jgi:hypothetical protein